MKPGDKQSDATRLRQRAEEVFQELGVSSPDSLAALTPEVASTLLHELAVHQIELEIQNEELRGAQLELETSRARYFDLYDHAPVGYATLSETGLILESNLTFPTLLGLARGALTRKLFSRFIFKADRGAFDLLCRQLLASPAAAPLGAGQVNKPQSCELRVIRDDGSHFWARLLCTSAPGGDGKVTLRVVLEDITEYKQVAESLAARERHLRAIFDTEPECVKILAADGSLLEINPAGLRMLQADSIQQVENHCVYPLVAGEHRAAFRELVAAVFCGNSGHLEFQMTGLKGARLWLETHASPLRDATGTITALLGITRDITEHKRAEAEVAVNEARFRAIFNVSPVPMAISNASGHITLLNPAFTETFGYDQADIPTLADWWPKTYPDSTYRQWRAAAWQAETARAQGTGTAFTPLELSIRCKDGTERFVLASAAALPLCFEGSHIVILHDITARKHAEAALRESEERFSGAFEHAPIGVVLVAPDGHFLKVNRAYCGLVGYTREELLTRSFQDITHPDDLEPDLEYVRRMLAGEISIYEMEKRYIHRQGHFVTVLLSVSLVRDGRGQPGYFISQVLDITKQKQVVEHLGLQSSALNAAANSIIIADATGTIVWANQAFMTLTDYRAEEVIGKKPQDLFSSGQQDQAFYKKLWDTILTGNVWHGTLTNRRKDGSPYPEEQTITPVKNNRGEVTHFIAIKRDLTQDKQMQAQLLQSQKMEVVGQLAAGIAHDFNNLLTVINGTADLAVMALSEDDPHRVQFLQIHRAGIRAAALTRQLLALSRQQVLAPIPMDLSALVVGQKGMLASVIGETIKLVVLPAPEPGAVMADPGQIEQVVMNLVVNARDAMPNGGTLTIETCNVTVDEAIAAAHPPLAPGPHVLLKVRDTGMGMDEATRTRVFEPFFTTKEIGRGSGLGLSTAFGIVGQSGGSIWVDSEPGKGATFVICLPRIRTVEQKREPDRPASLAHGTGTILIVEDEMTLRAFASRVLEMAGYTVLAAASGEEALQLLEPHDGPVDLMFTDMVMPGMGGTELAARLVDIRPRMKVLFASGYTNDQVLRDGLLNATSHFIGKPYSVTQLTSKVREMLES